VGASSFFAKVEMAYGRKLFSVKSRRKDGFGVVGEGMSRVRRYCQLVILESSPYKRRGWADEEQHGCGDTGRLRRASHKTQCILLADAWP